MKTQELRTLNEAELRERARTLEKELFLLRAKAIQDKLDKPSQFRQIRKEIARVLTLLNEMERGKE